MRVGCLLALPVLALVAVCARICADNEQSDAVHELESDDATMRATPSSDYLFSEHVPVLVAGGDKGQDAYYTIGTREPVASMLWARSDTMFAVAVVARFILAALVCSKKRPSADAGTAKAAAHAIGAG